MATTRWLGSTTSSMTLNGVTYRSLQGIQGSSLSVLSVDTVASGTEIEFIKFATPPVQGSYTISGAITFEVYGSESNMSANAGLRTRVFRIRGAVVDEMGGGPFNDGVELGTTAALMTWTGTPTSNNTLIDGDRIAVIVYATNVGVMASGHLVTIRYNDTDANLGDSFVTFTENITFYDDFEVTHVRFRNDDGNEAGATWIADANVDISKAADDPQFRFRLGVLRTGIQFGSSNLIGLAYRKNSGAWTEITSTSANVRGVLSTHYVEGDNTTQQVTSGSFSAGEMLETIANFSMSFPTGNGVSTEFEGCIDLQQIDLTPGDVLEFNFWNRSNAEPALNNLGVTVTIGSGAPKSFPPIPHRPPMEHMLVR